MSCQMPASVLVVEVGRSCCTSCQISAFDLLIDGVSVAGSSSSVIAVSLKADGDCGGEAEEE